MIRFADKFVLEREIGSGGMSRVFLGRDEVLDRPVAVKILKPGFGETDIGARFRREGRTAAKLSHPNIVQVYDAGEGEFEGREVSYIVMEYVSGGDLKRLIDERGALPGRDLARLSGVAAGLAHAHERGVIHRDIKPHNILLDVTGRPKLTDFGIARALDATYATRTGSYLGTALYSSPEQLRAEEVTPKSDVYSLGVTLYHAATGQTPFSGAPIEVASQHVSREPAPPRRLNEAVSASLEALILDCLKKNPDSRPSADEVRLRLLEAGRGVHATRAYAEPPTAEDERTPATAGATVYGERRGNRRVALAVLALVALLALVGIIGAPMLLGGGDQRANVPGRNADNPSGGGPGQNQQQEPPARQPAAQQAPPGQSGQDQADGGLTEAAAERTVEEFYASAAEENYNRSSQLLSEGWRQSAFPSQSIFQGTFGTLQSIEFIEGPTAEISGDTATVTGVTEATHTDRIEQNEGTWRLVNVDGEWKIDGWTVNNISTQRV